MSAKLAAVALVAVVVVAAAAVYAIYGMGGGDEGQEGPGDSQTDPTTPTDPSVPADPESPTDPEEPTDPEDPDVPTEPTDPEIPSGTSSFTLRTDVVVGDTVTLYATDDLDPQNPIATVTIEVTEIINGTMNLNISSIENGEVMEESYSGLSTSLFPEIYLILFAYMPGYEPGDPIYVGTETIDTVYGSLECSHYSVSNFGDVWYYPGTEFPALIVSSDGRSVSYLDATILVPAN